MAVFPPSVRPVLKWQSTQQNYFTDGRPHRDKHAKRRASCGVSEKQATRVLIAVCSVSRHVVTFLIVPPFIAMSHNVQ